MNNTQPNQFAPIQMKGALAAQSQKLAYAAPVLQVYGSVAQLTQGAGSKATDYAYVSGEIPQGPRSM